MGLAFQTLPFLQRGVCLCKERALLSLGSLGQPLVVFALVTQLNFQGLDSLSSGAGSLGPRSYFRDQVSPQVPVPSLKVRALEPAYNVPSNPDFSTSLNLSQS